MSKNEEIKKKEGKEIIKVSPEVQKVVEQTHEEALKDFGQTVEKSKNKVDDNNKQAENSVSNKVGVLDSDKEAIKLVNSNITTEIEQAEIEANKEISSIFNEDAGANLDPENEFDLGDEEWDKLQDDREKFMEAKYGAGEEGRQKKIELLKTQFPELLETGRSKDIKNKAEWDKLKPFEQRLLEGSVVYLKEQNSNLEKKNKITEQVEQIMKKQGYLDFVATAGDTYQKDNSKKIKEAQDIVKYARGNLNASFGQDGIRELEKALGEKRKKEIGEKIIQLKGKVERSVKISEHDYRGDLRKEIERLEKELEVLNKED